MKPKYHCKWISINLVIVVLFKWISINLDIVVLFIISFASELLIPVLCMSSVSHPDSNLTMVNYKLQLLTFNLYSFCSLFDSKYWLWYNIILHSSPYVCMQAHCVQTCSSITILKGFHGFKCLYKVLDYFGYVFLSLSPFLFSKSMIACKKSIFRCVLCYIFVK